VSRERTIIQFMWGYQPHFRSSVRSGTEVAFEAVGFHGQPVIFLVGFKIAGDHEFDICIEPEEGPYEPSDFAAVATRADDLYRQNPESEMWYSAAHLHAEIHKALRDEMRADAIAEVFQGHPASSGRTFFASRSTRVDDYEVHVVLGVLTEELSSVPRLQTTRRDRFRVAPSLVHALIDEALTRASRALYLPNPGHDLLVLGVGIPEIVRSATTRLVQSAFVCAGHWSAWEADLLLSSISALPYEGRSGVGTIVLAEPDNPAIEVLLKLQRTVKFRESRAVRKLLEASGSGSDLLVCEIGGTGSVYGLGRVSPNYDATSETVFRVSVLGRGAWDLDHAGIALLSVRDGVAHLPVHVLNEARLEDLVHRLLPDPDTETLVELARAAGKNEHGAMLIVSSDAAAEAKRFTPQAWAIEPTRLSAETLRQLTAMDGAVLVDPQGRCHAIGVILDGRASGQGDPARGSRFNNAVRYLDSEPPPAIVIVYSADGSIDVLPNLHPRIARQTVTTAVERYLELAAERPPRKGEVSAARDTVGALAFYLSGEQCSEINSAQTALAEWRKEQGEMQIIYPNLQPDRAMDGSYWLSS
jgi:hypothetical protein